jgi:hypothetical protein
MSETIDLILTSLAVFDWRMFGCLLAVAVPVWCGIGYLITLAEQEGDRTDTSC